MSTKARTKGTPLWNLSKKFNFAAEKIIPDSFVFCVILMIVVIVLSLILCGKTPIELLNGWWNGLSSQFTLAFQMGLMVIVCATCARSPQVAKMLNERNVYSDIVAETGASTATISRVNRSINYGSDGYAVVFERIKKKHEND